MTVYIIEYYLSNDKDITIYGTNEKCTSYVRLLARLLSTGVKNTFSLSGTILLKPGVFFTLLSPL